MGQDEFRPRPKLAKLLDKHGIREVARQLDIDHSRTGFEDNGGICACCRWQ